MLASKMKREIYLDNASTTPLDEKVLEEMMAIHLNCYGNPSSIHSTGSRAKSQLDNYRARLAGLINAREAEVVFTSSGTEANNLALTGVALANWHRGNHLVISAIEHDSVINTCRWLATQGFSITILPVDTHGIIDLQGLKRAINSNTILVSIMHVNNETGTMQSIAEIGAICKQAGVYFHTDACQSFGKTSLDVDATGISLMTLNSHKIHGPKGVGALYVREGVLINPIIHGGGQEAGLRPSTENLPGVAGFVRAAEIACLQAGDEKARVLELRNQIIAALQSRFDNFYLNGHPEKCQPNIINFALAGLEGETMRLLLLLDDEGVAVSTGSACSNNDTTKSASHVLQAMGRDQFEARGAIRVSLGRFNTTEDIEYFVKTISQKIKMLNPIFS